MGKLNRTKLWGRLQGTTERALGSGALQPIPTEFLLVEQDGVTFLVRKVANLVRKSAVGITGRFGAGGKRPNPFLPHDTELFVDDLSSTHLAVLNKFNVVDHHLLIVTREFEDQESLLTLQDFEALWLCMAEYDALGFYNSGRVAGASQPHKHLQMVPLPLGSDGPATPVDPLIGEIDRHAPAGPGPSLPYAHVAAGVDPAWFQRPDVAGPPALERYHALLRSAGLLGSAPPDPATRVAPYNLLVTRRWMLVVPRGKEFAGTISINALGFAGSLFVRNDAELDWLREIGPMTALTQVAG